MRANRKILFAAFCLLALVIAASRLPASPTLSPKERDMPVASLKDENAEELFRTKYLAYVTLETPVRAPLALCEACILQCAQNDLKACREACARACGMD